jgi:hypothetical protein
VETRAEAKLSPTEAGEDKTPGEVTVKKAATAPVRTDGTRVPEATLTAFRQKQLEVKQQHQMFRERVYDVLAERQPLSAIDLRTLIYQADGSTTEDSTAVRNSLRELEDEGRVVKRKEEDPERLIRGGGSFPKGGRVFLFGTAPGPVPMRTSLPDGVAPYKGAADWEKERLEQLDALCDKVLTAMNTRPADGSRVPRSAGSIATAAGLSKEEARLALERLIKLELIYKGESSGNYHLTERRRVAPGAKPRPVIPPYANGSPDQEAARDAARPVPEATVSTVPEPPTDLAAEVAALIARHTAPDTGELEQLREQNARLEETVARLQKQVTALRGAIAAMED